MKRRDFIRKAALNLVVVSGLVALAGWLRQFFPRLAGEKKRITIGDSMQYPVDTYTFLEEHNLFVYKDHEGIRAVSAICTHLGCTIDRTTEGFECPCHGSVYNDKGEVLSGPAPRSLSWYRVSRAPDGKVFIDQGTTVEADDKYLIS